MAETLGSLCDKLSIVQLKNYHNEDLIKEKSLKLQIDQLIKEIDEYFFKALNREIDFEKLVFKSNKVHNMGELLLNEKKSSSLGKLISNLSNTNCLLWHEQEKIYEFENVPNDKKNDVIKKVAILNLERTKYIDLIDENLQKSIKQLS